jgi:hypothetical protein
VKKTGNHVARRARASSEPSPLTGLRDMLAAAFAADVVAITPMVCDVLRAETGASSVAARRDAIRNALVIVARQSAGLAVEVAREFRSCFDARLLPALDFLPEEAPAQDSGSGHLGEGRRDLELALRQCAARLAEQAGAEVLRLTARVCAMLDTPSLDDSENPIAPEVLARALMQALAGIGLDDAQRLTVFKAYGPALLHIAPDLYQHADSLLAELGVLPELKAQYGRPLAARPATASPRPAPALDEGSLATILDRLLSGQRATTVPMNRTSNPVS